MIELKVRINMELDSDNARSSFQESANGAARHITHRNVVLMGVTGSGKSETGRCIARLLGFGFMDVDALTEQMAGMPIAQLVESKGEDVFRQIERDVVTSLKGVQNQVIATGGGTVVDSDNWEILKEIGVTVWLNPDPMEIVLRLRSKVGEIEKRPLLSDVLTKNQSDEETSKELQSRVATILASRKSRYSQADVTVFDRMSTSEASAAGVVRALSDEGFKFILRNNSSSL